MDFFQNHKLNTPIEKNDENGDTVVNGSCHDNAENKIEDNHVNEVI